MITLADAATYVKTGKVSRFLRLLLIDLHRVFTFTAERANRVKRFVKIVNAYRDGVMINDIEVQYGCSRFTVLRYARMAGLAKRKRGYGTDVRAIALEMYKANRPIAEIKNKLGVSEAYVSKLATAEGINRRHFKKRKWNQK